MFLTLHLCGISLEKSDSFIFCLTRMIIWALKFHGKILFKEISLMATIREHDPDKVESQGCV